MKLRLAAMPSALALALALSPCAALAQQSLTPPPAATTPPPAEEPPRRLPAPIETQELRQLDAWSVAAITRQQGALDANLWERSDANFVAALLDRVPSMFESPAVSALTRRVLYSGGDGPRGDAPTAARKRFEALGRIGAAEALAVMAAGAGSGASDPAIATYAAQAELARGNRVEACQRGRAAANESTSAFLLRLRAFCAAAGGDRAAADLALELARGSGGQDDPWYTGAVAAAGGAPSARPPAARYGTSLDAQLSIAAGLRPGPNPLNNASTLALSALARNERAPQPVRAQAAALAYRRGALTAAETRAIFQATPPEITSGLPPAVVALRQVEAAPGTLAAATAIAGELRRATAIADFAATSRFFHQDIAALTTAPDPASALLFARAAVATEDMQLATRLVQSAGQAGIDRSALAPLETIIAIAGRVRGEATTAVVRTRIASGGASLSRATARDVTLMAALGFQLDGDAQTFLLTNAPQGGVRADAGAMAALHSAVERRAVAEGALLAAIAAGEGPSRLDADSAAEIIRALRALRLDDEARRFAIEAILAGAPS